MDEIMDTTINNSTRTFRWGDYEIRVIRIDGKPWFVAVDVCKALDIKNPTQAVSRLDDDERTMLNIGRQGATNIVNEYGLYALVLSSRKPEAKDFKRWVTHEVLPAVNHTGVYAQTPEALTAAFLKSLTENPRGILALVEQNVMLQEENLAQKKQLAEQAPKVEKHDQLMSADGGILMKELAGYLTQNGAVWLEFLNGKRKKMGQNNLYEWMREQGYLCKATGERYNLPMQRYIDQGLFILKAAVADIGSVKREVSTTLVTPKGQSYFLDLFLKKVAIVTVF